MEIHKYICDFCEKELDETKFTISQDYFSYHYGGLDREFERRRVKKEFHLCPDCWEKVYSLLKQT